MRNVEAESHIHEFVERNYREDPAFVSELNRLITNLSHDVFKGHGLRGHSTRQEIRTGLWRFAMNEVMAMRTKSNLVETKGIWKEMDEEQRPTPAYMERPMSTAMLVSEIMVNSPVTISPESSVADAKWIFKTNRIGGLPVVSRGKLVGIITLIDTRRVSRYKDRATRIRDVMSTPPYSVYPDEKASVALQKMNEARIGRICVVSREDSRRLIGLVSLVDLRRPRPRTDDREKPDNTIRPTPTGGRTQEETGTPDYKQWKENIGWWDRLLKNTDAVYWKKTIQEELDKRWSAFDSSTEKLVEDFNRFKEHYVGIPEQEGVLTSYKKEWAESLTSLGNLLNKNTTHEQQMWDTTQRAMKVESMKVAQKFKDSDVDEIRFNNMREYIRQYPELQAQSTISRLMNDVNQKRAEIIEEETKYRGVIKESNLYLNTARNKLQKVQDELEAFEAMRKEGEEKVNSAQGKGIIRKIQNIRKTAAEKESTKLNFFEYDRKINASKNQLHLIKEDLTKYEERSFKPIVTQKFDDIET